MKRTILILYIVVMFLGCVEKSEIEGPWEFRWQSEDMVFASMGVQNGIQKAPAFNYIYYLTGKKEIGESGNIIVEGIQVGEYSISGTNIKLDLLENYEKLIGVEVKDYVGQVIDDQYMEGEVSFRYNGKIYNISWDAEKL